MNLTQFNTAILGLGISVSEFETGTYVYKDTVDAASDFPGKEKHLNSNRGN